MINPGPCCSPLRCCGNLLPLSLVASFSNPGDTCPGLGGNDVSLHFVSDDDGWMGTGSFCGVSWSLQLKCEVISGEQQLSLALGANDCLLSGSMVGYPISDCLPINWLFNFGDLINGGQDCTCCPPNQGGDIDIVVTE